MRKDVATALNALGGGWFDRDVPQLRLATRLPELTASLGYQDAHVRGWTAQAIAALNR
jgi:hypothetical protein